MDQLKKILNPKICQSSDIQLRLGRENETYNIDASLYTGRKHYETARCRSLRHINSHC